MSSSAAAAPGNPLLRRRNSVILPTKLSLSHQSSSSSSITTTTTSSTTTATSSSSSSSVSSSITGDFELFSIKPVSYTSLRDILPPSAVNSPTATNGGGQSGSEISIRNRLVKQAAWAYLQPMSTSPDSSGRSFFRFPVNNPVFAGVIEFVDRFIFYPFTRAVDWLLRAVRIRSSR